MTMEYKVWLQVELNDAEGNYGEDIGEPREAGVFDGENDAHKMTACLSDLGTAETTDEKILAILNYIDEIGLEVVGPDLAGAKANDKTRKAYDLLMDAQQLTFSGAWGKLVSKWYVRSDS